MGTYISAVALLVAGAISMMMGHILPGSLCFIAGGLTYVRIAFLSASPQPMSVKPIRSMSDQYLEITQETQQIKKFTR